MAMTDKCALCSGPVEEPCWTDPDGGKYHRLCVPFAQPSADSRARIFTFSRYKWGKLGWQYHVECGLCSWKQTSDRLAALLRTAYHHTVDRHRSRRG